MDKPQPVTIVLPPDPADLTPEHVRALFRGDVAGVMRDILKLPVRIQPPEPVEVSA